MIRPKPQLAEAVTFAALLAAAERARKAQPRSRDTLRWFADLEPNLVDLRRALLAGSWRPGEPRRFVIYEPKRRLISAAPFADRVVHHALCAVLEPIFEAALTPHSFACRKAMGLHRAVEAAQRHLRRYRYALKCDIRHYFETVDNALLSSALERRIADRDIVDVLGRIIAAGSVCERNGRPVGIPIGNLTSQHFANLYLARMDHWILRRIGTGAYVRYMDDLLIFANDKRLLWQLERELAGYLETRLRLELKRSHSAVYRFSIGVPFLGLRVFRGVIRLQAAARRRLRRKMCAARRDFESGRIEHAELQMRVGGLLGYALAADSLRLRRSFSNE